MKDHEIAELVNTLWSISKDYGHTGSLRQRISNVIVPAIRKTQRDAMLNAAEAVSHQNFRNGNPWASETIRRMAEGIE